MTYRRASYFAAGILFLLLLMTGCTPPLATNDQPASTTSDAPATGQGPATDPTESTTTNTTQATPPSLTTLAKPLDGSQPFAALAIEELGFIQYAETQLVADCLDAAGYPQLKATVSDAIPEPALSYLVITPEMFGPTDADTARRLGYGEAVPLPPPLIISNSTTYDQATEQCNQDVWERLGGEAARDAVGDYYALGNDLYGAFIETFYTDRRTRDVFIERLECLADHGYPVDDIDAFLDDYEPSHFEITFGEIVADIPGEIPTYEPGTIEVLASPVNERYEPTLKEINLALADVACRHQTDFDRPIMNIVGDVQQTVIANCGQTPETITAGATALTQARGIGLDRDRPDQDGARFVIGAPAFLDNDCEARIDDLTTAIHSIADRARQALESQ